MAHPYAAEWALKRTSTPDMPLRTRPKLADSSAKFGMPKLTALTGGDALP